MTTIDVKVKDLQNEQIAEAVFGIANEKLYKDMIEKYGVPETNEKLFEQGLRASDPDITIAEIKTALENGTQEEINEVLVYAKDRLYNTIQFMSTTGDDGEEVFFAALATFKESNGTTLYDWRLANSIAKEYSDNDFKAAGVKTGDLKVVILEELDNGQYKPIKVQVDMDVLQKNK